MINGPCLKEFPRRNGPPQSFVTFGDNAGDNRRMDETTIVVNNF